MTADAAGPGGRAGEWSPLPGPVRAPTVGDVSEDALGAAVSDALKRIQRGELPTADEAAELRRQARDIDRTLGAMMRPDTAREA